MPWPTCDVILMICKSKNVPDRDRYYRPFLSILGNGVKVLKIDAQKVSKYVHFIIFRTMCGPSHFGMYPRFSKHCHFVLFCRLLYEDSMANTNEVFQESDFLYETTSMLYGTMDPMNTTENGTLAPQMDFEDHSRLNIILATYVTPTLFFLSVIGNSLIFAVFSMKTYKTSLTAMLYRVLAVTDGISVVIRVGVHALPITDTEISCKIVMFIFVWSRVFSVWLIVVITAARVIIVWAPHKAKRLNTKKRYAYIILSIVLALCILYVPVNTVAGHNIPELEGQASVCMFFASDDAGKMEWYRSVFNYSIFLSIIITLLFVFIANILIVHGIRRSRQSVKTATPTTSASDKRKNNNVTILLLISSTSVIFNLPDVVYVVLSNKHKGTDDLSSLLTLRAFLPVFDTINRSINIIFFSLFGQEFRQNLKQLFSRPCIGEDTSNILPLSSRSSWFIHISSISS